MVAGGDEQPVRAERADERQVVRAPGPQPRRALHQRVLGDAGQDPLGVAQQVAHPADRHLGVEAQLRLRRADDEPAVVARHGVDRAAVHERAHRAPRRRERARAVRDPQDLALDRPHQAVQRRVQRRGVRARGDEHGLRLDVAGVGADAGDPHAVVEDGPGRAFHDRDARPLGGGAQRGEQHPVVDGEVAGHREPAADVRAERGLQAAQLPAREPLDVAAEAGQEAGERVQLGAVA